MRFVVGVFYERVCEDIVFLMRFFVVDFVTGVVGGYGGSFLLGMCG